jgi:hypothetical protein
MSTFLRPSAAIASVIVISAAFGFGVAATVLSSEKASVIVVSNGPVVASPGASRENVETRSIAGLKTSRLATRSISLMAYAVPNPLGPVAGNVHANLGRTRAIAPACLMAMN